MFKYIFSVCLVIASLFYSGVYNIINKNKKRFHTVCFWSGSNNPIHREHLKIIRSLYELTMNGKRFFDQIVVCTTDNPEKYSDKSYLQKVIRQLMFEIACNNFFTDDEKRVITVDDTYDSLYSGITFAEYLTVNKYNHVPMIVYEDGHAIKCYQKLDGSGLPMRFYFAYGQDSAYDVHTWSSLCANSLLSNVTGFIMFPRSECKSKPVIKREGETYYGMKTIYVPTLKQNLMIYEKQEKQEMTKTFDKLQQVYPQKYTAEFVSDIVKSQHLDEMTKTVDESYVMTIIHDIKLDNTSSSVVRILLAHYQTQTEIEDLKSEYRSFAAKKPNEYNNILNRFGLLESENSIDSLIAIDRVLIGDELVKMMTEPVFKFAVEKEVFKL